MKTKTLLALIAMALMTDAALAEQVKVADVRETTYLARIDAKADGTTELVPGVLWTGEKVVVQDGKCMHIKQQLMAMETTRTTAGDYEVQVPVLKSSTTEIDCAARRAGTLDW